MTAPRRQWRDEPIVIPRGLLVAKYAVFILLGAVTTWATVPSINAVVGDWYTPVWGVVLAIAASIALIGSLSDRKKFERTERIGVSAVFALLTVFAISPVVLIFQGDADRATYSVVAVAVSLVPGARAFYLLRRTGEKRDDS